ncbi:hypothetical protein SNEBB_007577 [Seison nebaliae]|nr:hypothetical protein SNEBB_007577 [Seison nebaliae]
MLNNLRKITLEASGKLPDAGFRFFQNVKQKLTEEFNEWKLKEKKNADEELHRQLNTFKQKYGKKLLELKRALLFYPYIETSHIWLFCPWLFYPWLFYPWLFYPWLFCLVA